MVKMGTLIRGKYEIVELAGKGGMSTVYRAIDVNLKKEWAIKEISKRVENEADRIRIQSAIAEANMMKKFDHPSIPRVVDIIEETDAIYVVMDYIEGETLEALLKKRGVLPVDDVVECAKALCEVLFYLHRQNPPIIYRDMKPGNVIITTDGNVKLIDFGIAREYKVGDMTDTVCLGTRGYAAPEQATGISQTDPRSDIYNLGMTFYELLTGKNPGKLSDKRYSVRRWRPELPEGLEYIVGKCLQQNPQDRYQDCGELLADLENYNSLDKQGKTKDFYKKRRFWKEILAGFGSLLLAFAILFIVYFLKGEYTAVSDYDNRMLEALNAVTPEEKLEHYLNAIEAKPGEVEPYLALISIMEEDAKFEVLEEQMLQSRIEKNLHALQKHEEYAKLAYELGELYWHCYDYGRTENADNWMTRIKSAYRWFEDARQYGKDTDEFYADIQNYCAMGDYVETLLQKPSVAAGWGNYEVYRKETRQVRNSATDEIEGMDSRLESVIGSVYVFEDSLTRMMGKYLQEGEQVKVTEMNTEPLCMETMCIFLEENGVVRQLAPEQEYTVTEKEKIGEWHVYEYCVNERVFFEEGVYGIEVFSMDETGRIYQNVRGLSKIEIAFGIDKTPPNILLIDIADTGWGAEEKCIVTFRVEDNMMLDSVEVYANKEVCDVIADGEQFSFEVEKNEAIETITVIARDAAGNEARRELEEVREAFEHFTGEK